MLTIRFHREGKKKSPTYRIVVTESSRPAQGKYLEKLGSYNPKSKAAQLNAERILHWLSKGAQVSPTVHNLLVKHGVIQAKKIAKHAKKKGKEEVVAAPTPESVSVDTTGEAGIE